MKRYNQSVSEAVTKRFFSTGKAHFSIRAAVRVIVVAEFGYLLQQMQWIEWKKGGGPRVLM